MVRSAVASHVKRRTADFESGYSLFEHFGREKEAPGTELVYVGSNELTGRQALIGKIGDLVLADRDVQRLSLLSTCPKEALPVNREQRDHRTRSA